MSNYRYNSIVKLRNSKISRFTPKKNDFFIFAINTLLDSLSTKYFNKLEYYHLSNYIGELLTI